MRDLRKRLASTIRKKRGTQTQRAFASKMRLSHATINRIEQGEENVTINTLQLLCKGLKCDIGALFEDE